MNGINRISGWVTTWKTAWICGLLMGAAGLPSVQAEVIYQSAVLRPGFFFGGSNLGPVNYLAHRFEVTSELTIRSVGATLFVSDRQDIGNGKIFAAVVGLTGADDVPDSLDLSTQDVMGVTLIRTPRQGSQFFADKAANLTLDLTPGWYALVLGSGQFGATANAVGVYMPLAGMPAPLFRDTASWRDPGFASSGGVLATHRVFVDTRPIPEPATFGMLGLGALMFLRRRR